MKQFTHDGDNYTISLEETAGVVTATIRDGIGFDITATIDENAESAQINMQCGDTVPLNYFEAQGMALMNPRMLGETVVGIVVQL